MNKHADMRLCQVTLGSMMARLGTHPQAGVRMRRGLAAVSIAVLAVGGVKVVSDHAMSGIGFSAVQTAAADPTGPTGGPGGDGGMNGSQFQPPGLPAQQPDYQGGINQPPLDQNSGISIYNSGNPQAPQQVPGQQGSQSQQGVDQPAHGTQIPDYSTAPGYTQGPGQSNPDYQAPQQGSQPQQGQQPEQGTQNQQPSQAPTQTQQPNQDDRQDQQRQKECEQQAEDYGILQEFVSLATSGVGGAGSVFKKPDRGWQPAFQCSTCPPSQQKPQSKNGPCDWPVIGGLFCETVTGTAQPDPNVTPTKPKETTKPQCPQIPATANGSDDNGNPESIPLDGKRLQYAKTIVSEASKLGFDKQGALIALMTSMTESRLLNPANTGVPASMSIPHDLTSMGIEGQDGLSLGLFQQQYGITLWGLDINGMMDPATATRRFLQGAPADPANGYPGTPGLSSVSYNGEPYLSAPWKAAQAVQLSYKTDGSNYQRWYDAAQKSIDGLWCEAGGK